LRHLLATAPQFDYRILEIELLERREYFGAGEDSGLGAERLRIGTFEWIKLPSCRTGPTAASVSGKAGPDWRQDS